MDASTSGNLYITGTTSSSLAGNSPDCNAPPNGGFPLCDPPGSNDHFDDVHGGNADAFIFRLSDDELTWSTFFGQGGHETVQDITYISDPINAVDDIVIVGGTNGTIPQNSIGVAPYLQTGDPNADNSGWVAQFGVNGNIKWSTNVRELYDLQAVTGNGSRIIVSGVTKGIINPVVNNCEPQGANAVPICDPGGNAFVNSNGNGDDIYIAEFHPVTNEMIWSTLYGGATDERGYFSRFALGAYSYHGHYMEMELETNGPGDLGVLYLMALSEMVDPSNYFSTVNYQPFYNRSYDTNIGYNQSDVVLMCFPNDRSLIWAALFGGLWPTSGDDVIDQAYIEWGSEIGTAMTLSVDNALYIGGFTGNYQMPLECPYPGTSYCEANLTQIFTSDMFISRFNIQNIDVGVQEGFSVPANGILNVVPVLGQESVLVSMTDNSAIMDLAIYNAQGALMWNGNLSGSKNISVVDWSNGIYLAIATDQRTPRQFTNKFFVE